MAAPSDTIRGAQKELAALVAVSGHVGVCIQATWEAKTIGLCSASMCGAGNLMTINLMETPIKDFLYSSQLKS